jgi:type IV pilus assembly protein PilC
MPTFHYKAARPNGTTVAAHLDALDELTARKHLEHEGLIVFNLKSRGQNSTLAKRFTWSRRKVSIYEFLIFNQELLALLKAGLPILQVWDLLIERAERDVFRQTLRLVREDIRSGSAASEAMSRHPHIFSDLYVATIRAGEQAGNLPTVLHRYVMYLKLMISLKQKVGKAFAYPAFLIVVGVAVIGFLLMYVMPTFIAVYGESARELPAATQTLLDLITILQTRLIAVAIVLLMFVIGFRSYRATPHGRLITDRILLTIPGIGSILSNHYTVQLVQTLATVLAGGIPLVEALHVASGAVSNQYIAQGLARSTDQIRQGVPLASAVAAQGIVPKLATAMIGVGEETGSLETMLRDIGEFYEGNLDLKLTQMTTWIEPVLLLVMGGIVGSIVVIMYLPVFQMAGTVQ